MGMFDYVIADLFCCYCGYKIPQENERDYWQCKAGPCLLDTYTQEAFEKEIHQTGQYRLAGHCNNCKKNLQYLIWNESEDFKKFADQESEKFKQRLRDQQTAKHPDHPFSGGNLKAAFVMNAWCNKCKELGVENGNLPPDASEDHKKEIESKHKDFVNRSNRVFNFVDNI